MFAQCIASDDDILGRQYLGMTMSDLHKITCNALPILKETPKPKMILWLKS
jgi:hypothetical protein